MKNPPEQLKTCDEKSAAAKGGPVEFFGSLFDFSEISEKA